MRNIAWAIIFLFHAVSAYAQIFDVRELNTEEIQRLDREHTAVLLQGGILEEHGPYLPSYSDGYQTEFIATRLAEAIVARPGWTVLRFPPVTGHNMEDLVTLAKTREWPGYFGTPSIATAAAGSRAMIAIAGAAVGVALEILNGTAGSEMPRVADLAEDSAFKPVVEQTLEHDRSAEQRQAAWLAKHQ